MVSIWLVCCIQFESQLGLSNPEKVTHAEIQLVFMVSKHFEFIYLCDLSYLKMASNETSWEIGFNPALAMGSPGSHHQSFHQLISIQNDAEIAFLSQHMKVRTVGCCSKFCSDKFQIILLIRNLRCF